MKLRWSKWRTAAAVIAGCLLVLGVYLLLDGRRRWREFRQWEAAKPMDVATDFSQPGIFASSFKQTCSQSHGETVLLRVPDSILSNTTPTMLMQGLRAQITIRTLAGEEIYSSTSELLWDDQTMDGAIPIFSLDVFRRGDYEAAVKIHEGAPALAGVNQRLEVRYLLCGLESLPASIATLGGSIVGVLGLLVGFVLAVSALPLRSPPNHDVTRHQ